MLGTILQRGIFLENQKLKREKIGKMPKTCSLNSRDTKSKIGTLIDLLELGIVQRTWILQKSYSDLIMINLPKELEHVTGYTYLHNLISKKVSTWPSSQVFKRINNGVFYVYGKVEKALKTIQINTLQDWGSI